jgi:hypothetical protein
LHFVSFAFASEIFGDVHYLRAPTAVGTDDTPEYGRFGPLGDDILF